MRYLVCDRIRAQGPARRVDGNAGGQAQRVAQDQFLVAELRVQLGQVGLRGTVSHRTGTPGREHGRLRPGQIPNARVMRLDAVVDATNPGRSPPQPARGIARGEYHRGRAVGDRRTVRGPQRRHHGRLGEHFVRRQRPGRDRVRVGGGVAPAARGDVREVAFGVPARVQVGAGRHRSQRDLVEPEGRQVIRVELQGHDLPQVTLGGLAERVHQRGVDVPVLQPHPRLVQGPGAVHLDVALRDRRPGADRVERRDKRERYARQVVAAARAGEPDLGTVQADLLEHIGDHRLQHFGLAEPAVGAGVLGLRERHDRDLTHRPHRPSRGRFPAAISTSPNPGLGWL